MNKNGSFLEKYELNITPEESRNYHDFFPMLKVLNLNNWVRAYIHAIIYSIFICTFIMFCSTNTAVLLWYNVPLPVKVLLFMVIFIYAALKRSKAVQLRQLLRKYFVQNMQQEVLTGTIQLKKIKVEKDKILVYFIRKCA